MLKRNSKLVLWIGVLAVLACSLSAGATTFNFPNSSITNAIMDPTKWETAALPHVNPTVDDFASAGNTWTIYYKRVLVAPITSPVANFRIVGPVIYHGAVATSAANEERTFYFNGNSTSTYDIVGTFDDLRLQGTMQGATTRRPFLDGNLRLTTDANGLKAHTAIQVRSGQQLNITAAIDAADCNSIDIVRYTYGDTTSDSQVSLRNTGNKIYSKFFLDAGLYGFAAGSLGDADVEINGSSTVDYRAGKLNIQATGAISSTAKVSIITDATGLNTDAVRIALGTNSATIRELWIDGVKQVGSPATFSTASTPSATWLSGTGTLTVTNTPTVNLTMVASPAGDPNIRIYPPVGTKAYAEGYTVNLSAPNPKDAPYKFINWTSTYFGTASPVTSANTTVTMPVGTNVTVTANYVGAACSPAPADTQTNVNVFTNLSWTAAPSETAQTVYFGTTNPPTTVVANVGNIVSNATIGRLVDNKTYYWRVDSTIGGNVIAGNVWSFTSATSIPDNPFPVIGAIVNLEGTRMTWSEAPSAGGTTLHSVYFSTDSAAVTARTAPTITPDANGWYLSGPLVVSKTYYWAVDATYRDDANGVLGIGAGPTWNFVAARKSLYLKTEIAGYNINGTGDVNGVANGCYVDDANTVVYKFATFNYDDQWNIVVSGPKKVAIWSDAGISIGGTLDVSGYTYTGTATRGDATFGPAHAGNNAGVPGGYVFSNGTAGVNGIGFGGNMLSNAVGGGAGYGGAGGRAGRWSTVNGGYGGIAYGETEMFTLYAGSGGGGGRPDGLGVGGGGGGGAVELFAKGGNVTISSGALIKADGAPSLTPAAYTGGGGSGGGVRIIASGNVVMAGTVSANGARGGNNSGTSNANNTGGGGGGGRIAIYKGGTLTQTGTMTATGGVGGVNAAVPPAGWAGPGANGTIYTSGVTSTLLAAYNPKPTNGAGSWNLDPNFGGKTLSWNPALGTTENKVYFGTSIGSMTLKATYTAPTNVFFRDRKSYTPSPALVNGTKYYWRVDSTVNGSTVTGPVWTFGTGVCSNPAGDLNADCKVTFMDFALLAATWKVCNLLPTSLCN